MPPWGLRSSVQHHTSAHQNFHPEAPGTLVSELFVSAAQQRLIYTSNRWLKRLSGGITRSKWEEGAEGLLWHSVKSRKTPTHLAVTLVCRQKGDATGGNTEEVVKNLGIKWVFTCYSLIGALLLPQMYKRKETLILKEKILLQQHVFYKKSYNGACLYNEANWKIAQMISASTRRD